jgi:multidrug resistance efflux pump
MWAHRDKIRKEKAEHGERLEIHRDDLTFELLKAARDEVAVARIEMESLRDEVQTLRALEQHFYHFQQALDHLDAVLYAETADERATAERAAKAFVNRMRRLNEAKGTVANEAQRASSAIRLAEGRISRVGDKKHDDPPR